MDYLLLMLVWVLFLWSGLAFFYFGQNARIKSKLWTFFVALSAAGWIAIMWVVLPVWPMKVAGGMLGLLLLWSWKDGLDFCMNCGQTVRQFAVLGMVHEVCHRCRTPLTGRHAARRRASHSSA